jgi:hypothetical protein
MSNLVQLLNTIIRFDRSFIIKFFIFFIVITIFITSYILAHSYELTLAWDPNTESDLAGYTLCYGTVSKNYAQQVEVGKYESVTISGLELNKTYYFAVTAYDIQGNESDFSDEISYHACGCDLNRDGSCDGYDWSLFYPDWGRNDCSEPGVESCECDLNRDGICNGLDWQLFYPNWGRTDCSE